jgi:hypothetical protein
VDRVPQTNAEDPIPDKTPNADARCPSGTLSACKQNSKRLRIYIFEATRVIRRCGGKVKATVKLGHEKYGPKWAVFIFVGPKWAVFIFEGKNYQISEGKALNASFTNHCSEGLEDVVHKEEIPLPAVRQYACKPNSIILIPIYILGSYLD